MQNSNANGVFSNLLLTQSGLSSLIISRCLSPCDVARNRFAVELNIHWFAMGLVYGIVCVFVRKTKSRKSHLIKECKHFNKI